MKPDYEAPTWDGPAAQSPELLQPGALVGSRYRIVATLGSGGMGHVYRALDLELGREVALKTLYAQSPDALRRFRREVALAVRITHPNVVRLHDLGSAGTVPYLTMDLVDGLPLSRRIDAGPLPLGDAVAIAAQIAEGLTAAHEVGVVHRDLKPANILLGSDGRAVVVDFGVAGEAAEVPAAASAIVGTSAYMAPEQANGEAATPRADLYALGLVLYEMLTGQVPLTGNGPVATALLRNSSPPASLIARRPDAPPELDALVRRLLQRDPAARPESAGEVARVLKSLPARRRSWPWRRLLAALGALGLVAVFASRMRHPAGPVSRLALQAGVSAGLPDFLQPKVSWAAFRALAAQLPGRVTSPDQPAGDALAVTASLALHESRYRATLRAGAREFHGEAAAPAAALDEAAAELVRAWFPDAGVAAIRRAEIAYARHHDAEALSLIQPLRNQGSLRPYIIALNIEWDNQALAKEAAAQVSTFSGSDQALFKALGRILATDGRGTLEALPAGEDGLWHRVIRAWALGHLGRAADAFALAEHLDDSPELQGIALRLKADLVRNFDGAHYPDALARLSGDLAEEPGVWIETAVGLFRHSEVDGATEALAKARLVGAPQESTDPLEGELRMTRLDPAGVREVAARLAASGRPLTRLRGLMYQYAADVMAGDFQSARTRGLELARLFTEEPVSATVERGDRVLMAQDALLRGDHELARKFAQAGELFAERAKHQESGTRTIAFRLALDHIEKRISEATFRSQLAQLLAEGARHSITTPRMAWAGETARLFVAIARNDCLEIAGAAPSMLDHPMHFASVETARCEVARGDPAIALARLELRRTETESPVFVKPALLVRRELVLGEALTALGRRAEARPHLQKVVDLWGHTSRPEPTRARALLADQPR